MHSFYEISVNAIGILSDPAEARPRIQNANNTKPHLAHFEPGEVSKAFALFHCSPV